MRAAPQRRDRLGGGGGGGAVCCRSPDKPDVADGPSAASESLLWRRESTGAWMGQTSPETPGWTARNGPGATEPGESGGREPRGRRCPIVGWVRRTSGRNGSCRFTVKMSRETLSHVRCDWRTSVFCNMEVIPSMHRQRGTSFGDRLRGPKPA